VGVGDDAGLLDAVLAREGVGPGEEAVEQGGDSAAGGMVLLMAVKPAMSAEKTDAQSLGMGGRGRIRGWWRRWCAGRL
jgi:hypothetical protein